MTCSLGYFLNPVSSTCIRVVSDPSSWVAAKTDCEASGEHLAVFDTLESVQWLNDFLRSMTGEGNYHTVC